MREKDDLFNPGNVGLLREMREGLVVFTQMNIKSHGDAIQYYEVLHGGPGIHRDTYNTNARVARSRAAATQERDDNGFPNTKKGKRKSKLPRRLSE